MSGTVQTIVCVSRYPVLQILYINPAAVIYILHNNIIYYYVGHILCTAVDARGLTTNNRLPHSDDCYCATYTIIISILCMYRSKVTICILIHRRMTVWRVYNVQTVRCVFVVSQLSWAYAYIWAHKRAACAYNVKFIIDSREYDEMIRSTLTGRLQLLSF